MSRFDLVIFDCDGVLIDSERLAVRTESQILTELGWPMSEAEVIERFVGRSSKYMQTVIEERLGRSLDWKSEFERRVREVCERELVPVDGVITALDEIEVPSCVASSSSHEMLKFKLGLTGLSDRFPGRIFSADDVAHGKPDPAVFLYAAASMKVEPDRCAVIEDSTSGVEAGVAAGMSVFAFCGGVTNADQLERDGVILFDSMNQLPQLLKCT
ncbi:MAG TPA: HAD family hydrolase [Acidimicrobiales bacterium]|nr:HAD family hydrolase [Acidimicrobiales bacterium]